MAASIQRRLNGFQEILYEGWKKIGDLELRKSYPLSLKLIGTCTAALFGTALTAFLYLYRFKPKVLVQAIISWSRHKSGFTPKIIKDSRGFTYSYAERGRKKPGQPTIVLVPGLAGSIDNWVPVAMHMKDHHMIAVEMPGGGLTSCDPKVDLCILGQVERLKQFLVLLNLDDEHVHLVGAATGGTVVGCYAAMYPALVVKLTLICPALRSPIIGDVIQKELAGVDSGMIFSSPDTISLSLEVLSKKPRKLNKQVAKGLYELKKPNLLDARKLANSMLDDIWKGPEDTMLVPRLRKITAPTQVIWGQYDRVIHVSGADVLKDGLQNCVGVNILPSGHSIYMDEPKKLASLLEQFIDTD